MRWGASHAGHEPADGVHVEAEEEDREGKTDVGHGRYGLEGLAEEA